MWRGSSPFRPDVAEALAFPFASVALPLRDAAGPLGESASPV